MVINYLKRAYTVVEVRTGFVAASSAFIGVGYGHYIEQNFVIIPSILLIISCFFFNLVANVSSEIKGYLTKEDENMLTGHKGSEGLSRGDASLFDAVIALIICSIIAIFTGLLCVIISEKLLLIAIGCIGFIAAITYSLTPLSYSKYPVGEIISGLMCGFLCTLAGIMLYHKIDINTLIFCIIPFFMVNFLMAANNTVDYGKDLGNRVTLAHVLGFRNSILIQLIPFSIIFIIWFYLSFYIFSFVIFIFGLIILIYFGIYKWYLPYSKVTLGTPNLAREFGPKPLVLLLNFNFIIGLLFWIVR